MKNVPVVRGICFKEPLSMDLLDINMGPRIQVHFWTDSEDTSLDARQGLPS